MNGALPITLLLEANAAPTVAASSIIFNGANIASIVITIVLLIGVALRRNRKLHPPIMIACFVADLGLVVWLEVTRSAVETAVGNMSALMVTHIVLAVLMILSYVSLMATGFKVLRAKEPLEFDTHRKSHRAASISFFIIRVAVLVTALMVAADVGGAKGQDSGSPSSTGAPSERNPNATDRPPVKAKDGKTIP